VGDDTSRQIAVLFDGLPEHEKARLLQELATRNPAAAGLPKPISEHGLIRDTLLLNHNDVEFELTVRHPVAYPVLFPVDVAALPLKSLLGSRLR
jgi:hypothetical protein